MALTLQVGDTTARVTRAKLIVPRTGLWMCDVTLDSAVPAGTASLVLGATTLSGTQLEELAGTYLTRNTGLVVAGAGGWGDEIAEQDFRNDAEVTLLAVLGSTAAACGETLGTVPVKRLGVRKWVRARGAAGRAMHRLVPDWWVGFDGVTQVAARAPGTLAAGVELRNFDHRTGVAVFSCSEVTDITPGTLVSAVGKTVESVEFSYSDRGLEACAWLV